MPVESEAGLQPLETARWPQVAESARTLLIWPIGSTEQHGPHLPLGTDTIIASALAAEAHRHAPHAALAPAQAIGASGEHAHFPGTLSIGTEALTSVVVEFVRHACRTFDHVLVVNGHGGNVSALQRASELMRYEGRSLTVWHAAGSGPRSDAHAGFQETSLMLYLSPETVRADLAAAGATQPLAQLLEPMRAGGVIAVSPNGVLGDPTGATALRGQALFEEMFGRLLAVVDSLTAHRSDCVQGADKEPPV
ncbi:creatinine amidohydrolase [Nakamurella sp. UYEF19]|uniref:mycofactocin biosynthesis peptidyl-dipeptidase MftE n=1 Tax=Nakamurella sp. UYEF19 TaxID=1756392 RepID=UPI003399C04F